MADRREGRLGFGLVGGGPGAFIGRVHVMAAQLDGRLQLSAGAFSRDPAKSKLAGEGFGVSSDRAYGSWADMLAAEARRTDGISMVVVATPNDSHFAISKAALEAGFHVMCDKPATLSLDEALALRDVVAKSGRQYGLTYTYSGYPLVREARARVAAGALGSVRKIVVEYPQGWLSQKIEGDSKQAEWRTDPKRSGLGGCLGDIGIHAMHLAEFVSGLYVTELLADLGHVVPGRLLDDDCDILLRFNNGARGALIASQISAGERNGIRLRIYGEKGGLDWSQETPNTLTLNFPNQPSQVLHAGGAYLSAEVQAMIRIPAGHPEGYLEAFANLYREFAGQIAGQASLVPGIEAGVRGMAFIQRAVESSDKRQWLSFESPGHS